MANFLDKLFGRQPRLRPFAEEIRERLAAKGIGPLTVDEEHQELRGAGDEPGIYFLGDVFTDYCRAPTADRAGILLRYVDAMAGTGEPLPAVYGDARTRILPIVRTLADESIAALQARRTGMSDGVVEDLRPATRPLVGDLTAGLAYDSRLAISRLTKKQLADWNVDFDQVLGDALANLRALPETPGWVELKSGVWSGQWGDGYESSRLLLPDLIHRLGVHDPVVSVPLRSMLLVASARDTVALAEMARMSREAIETQTRWLSTQPIQLVGGAWRMFQSPSDSQGFRDVRAIELASVYADQKAALEDLYERDSVDIFVASLLLFEKHAGGICGAATWTEGVDSLLPVAELVAFHRTSGTESTITVRWADAVTIAGTLMKPTDLFPLRYRVRTSPDDAQWEQLVSASRAIDP